MLTYKLRTAAQLLALSLGLALVACAAPYRVIPVQVAAVPDPGTVANPSNQNRHEVRLEPVTDLQGQYQRPRFRLSVKNLGKEPRRIAAENVEASLNGRPTKVMSYDAQVDELLNALRTMPQIHTGFYPYFQYRFSPFASMERSMDSIDVQQVQHELDQVRKRAFKPTVLEPGMDYTGEITLKNKLPAQADQELLFKVKMGAETHPFQFALQQLRRP